MVLRPLRQDEGVPARRRPDQLLPRFLFPSLTMTTSLYTEVPIEVLKLPGHAYGALLRADLSTVEALCKKSAGDVSLLRGIGKASLEVIEKALAERGLSLYPEGEQTMTTTSADGSWRQG